MSDIEKAIAKAKELANKAAPGNLNLCADVLSFEAHARNTHKLVWDVVEAMRSAIAYHCAVQEFRISDQDGRVSTAYHTNYVPAELVEGHRALDALARAVLANGGE